MLDLYAHMGYNIKYESMGAVKEVKKITEANFDFGSNCFDLLRLFSALNVMPQHIVRHMLHVETPPFFNCWSGVVVLFCIRGPLMFGGNNGRKERFDRYVRRG